MIKNKSALYIYILIIGLWTVFPQVQVDMIYRLVVLACLVLSLLLILKKGKVSRYSFIALILAAIFGILDYVQGGFSNILSNFAFYFMFVLIVVFCYLQDKDEFLKYEKIYYIAVFFSTLINIRTIYGILTNDKVIRNMVLDPEGSKLLLKSGIGGFGHVFSQTILIWCSLFLLLYTENGKWKKVILILHIVSSVWLIYEAQFLVALISLIVGVIAFFLNKKQSSLVIKNIIFIAVVILFVINIREFLTFLYNISKETSYNEKIAQFLNFSNGEGLTGDSAARVNVYGKSISSFLRSPVFGSLFKQYGAAGGHSTIFDFLSSYGIIIGTFYIVLILLPVKYMKKTGKTLGEHNGNLLCFRMVILLSSGVSLILDPMGYHYWYTWYILMPIAYCMLLRSEKAHSETEAKE